MEVGFVFIAILPFLSIIAKPIRFNVESGVTKCVAYDLRIKSVTVGEYSVVNPNKGQPLPEHHRIYVGVFAETKTGFMTREMWNQDNLGLKLWKMGNILLALRPNHEPAVNTTVDFNWRSGVAAEAWTRVIKTGSVDLCVQLSVLWFTGYGVELKKMEDTVKWIHEEMLYLREREQETLKQNMKTNSITGWSSLVSLFLCLTVAGFQLWHLKSFFEKKII